LFKIFLNKKYKYQQGILLTKEIHLFI